MKSTIKLRRILEQYNCTFTLDDKNEFEVFVATKDDDTSGVFNGKSFSVVVGHIFSWMEKKNKSKKDLIR